MRLRVENIANEIPNSKFVRINLMHPFLHYKEIQEENRAIGIPLACDVAFEKISEKLFQEKK